MAMAIVITACALFFIPTTLIILGYYSSQPTGTLISPIPQTTLGDVPSVTPTITPENQPIIASNNSATQAANPEIAPRSESNITDKVAIIDSNTTEKVIIDSAIYATSQIYLSPRPGDKSLYSLKSKSDGQFTIVVDQPSDTVRYIDYHIVNP